MYFIHDDHPGVTSRVNNFEFLRPLVEGLGYPFPRVALPARLAYHLAYLLEGLHRALLPLWDLSRLFILTRAEVLKSSGCVPATGGGTGARSQRQGHPSMGGGAGWAVERGFPSLPIAAACTPCTRCACRMRAQACPNCHAACVGFLLHSRQHPLVLRCIPCSTHWFSVAKARRELGYTPVRHDFQPVVHWFLERGHGRRRRLTGSRLPGRHRSALAAAATTALAAPAVACSVLLLQFGLTALLSWLLARAGGV